MNAHMTNILGYEAYLSSLPGTLMDYTPPFPDMLVVGEITSDVMTADLCEGSINQRCHDVTEFENHRYGAQ